MNHVYSLRGGVMACISALLMHPEQVNKWRWHWCNGVEHALLRNNSRYAIQSLYPKTVPVTSSSHLGIKDVLYLGRVVRVELFCILTTIMEDLDNLAILKQRLQLC